MSVEAMAIVLNHSRAKGAAKIVLLGIANHINPDNDGAWPSQARLASYANITERAVRNCVDQLVELGELVVKVGAGNSTTQYKTNRYWLNLACPADCDGTTNHGTRRVEVFDNRVEVFDNQGGSPLPTNRNRTIKEPIIAQNEFEHEFDEFWKRYPRRTGKEAAKKSFVKQFKKHGQVIFDGLDRMVNDPNLPSKSFIPYPATWLNRGGWDDEPYPPRVLSPEEREQRAAVLLREANEKRRQEIAAEEAARAAAVADYVPATRCEHGRVKVICDVCSGKTLGKAAHG